MDWWRTDWEFLQQDSIWINLGILLAVTLVGYWVLRAILKIVSKRLAAKADKSHTAFLIILSEMLRHTSRVLLFAFSLLLALRIVDVASDWERFLSHGWFIALAFQIALWLDTAARLWMDSLTRDGKKRNPVTTTVIGIMIRLVVWTMMLLSILANLGVDITAMVASLGVGGIAIALALQTLLSDVFASLAIGIDKPFEIGDFVVFGEVAGNIEHIGLKTTRIRALSGEQIVCANADLLSKILHNYKRMNTRRIVFKFGIMYSTPTEKVREVATMVRNVVDAVPDTRFDRAHFVSFDDSQLTFEVVHIVQSSDYNRYMDIQQEINLGLLQGCRDLGVGFAFPTRSVEFVGGKLPEISVAGVPQGKSAANQQSAGD
ncbi:Small-conductance mechanosensitive channel [Halopseudomonas xinjiangensis]|uniref:Small-conductance mechanosensitive channel n=1 Tax=Halopseudomonas xinjiangensis TaxID=487184 RepID=A0A1H1W2N0_9GAMM|nr:mechanosensitive ion channel family protein [Halopseudomonas xinjiangensis]SDS90911.1 Small-conductance mechanosensitive channel [Halopseudomonas xinjiangensis]